MTTGATPTTSASEFQLEFSAEIADLCAALVGVQGDLGNPKADSKAEVRGPKANYDFRYASLQAVVDAARPALAKHGLAIIQMPLGDLLATQLVHKTGQWLRFFYPVRAVNRDPQGYGSAITYARRYTLMGVLGLAPEDDDGNMAMGYKVQADERRDAPQSARAQGSPRSSPAPDTSQPAPQKTDDPLTASKRKFLADVAEWRGNNTGGMTHEQFVQTACHAILGRKRIETMSELNVVWSAVKGGRFRADNADIIKDVTADPNQGDDDNVDADTDSANV